MAITFGNYLCLDPKDVLEACEDEGLSTAWLGKPNSFRCPYGETPGHGWLLMRRGDYQNLDPTIPQPLTFNDNNGNIVPFPSLYIAGQDCITPGAPGDQNAALLVEIVDKRWQAKAFTIIARYNVRTGTAPPVAVEFIPDSLFGGVSQWTWDQMVSDVWSNLPILGAYPGLPYAPDGTPESFVFGGTSAFEALNQILNGLSCALVYNPIADSFSIIQLGTNNLPPTAMQLKWRAYLIGDDEPSLGVRVNIPANLQVYFPAIALDGSAVPQFYFTTIANPTGTGTEPGSTASVWDDEAATYRTIGGIATVQNMAALTSRAAERATNFFSILNDPNRLIHQIYGAAIADFVPGPVTSVGWYDFEDGMKTEIVRVPGNISGVGLDGKPASGSFMGPADPIGWYGGGGGGSLISTIPDDDYPGYPGRPTRPYSTRSLRTTLPFGQTFLVGIPPLYGGTWLGYIGFGPNTLPYSVLWQDGSGDPPVFSQNPQTYTVTAGVSLIADGSLILENSQNTWKTEFSQGPLQTQDEDIQLPTLQPFQGQVMRIKNPSVQGLLSYGPQDNPIPLIWQWPMDIGTYDGSTVGFSIINEYPGIGELFFDTQFFLITKQNDHQYTVTSSGCFLAVDGNDINNQFVFVFNCNLIVFSPDFVVTKGGLGHTASIDTRKQTLTVVTDVICNPVTGQLTVHHASITGAFTVTPID